MVLRKQVQHEASCIENPTSFSSVWSCDEEYHNSHMKQLDVCNAALFTDARKGKCLQSTRVLDAGETVLTEDALLIAQNLEELYRIPVCHNCLLILEEPLDTLKRVISDSNVPGEKQAQLIEGFKRLPQPSTQKSPTFVQCRNMQKKHTDTTAGEMKTMHQKSMSPKAHQEPGTGTARSCPVRYCSLQCEDKAWLREHQVLCRATLTDKGCESLNEYENMNWEYAGVDYTDTLHMVLLAVAQTVSYSVTEYIKKLNDTTLDTPTSLDRVDFDEKTFAAGFYPFQMMIRAPLGTFPFRYLLTEDDAERVAKNLEEYTASPFEDKVVAHAIQESLCTEHTFFQRALNLMKSIFCAQDSTEERAECERSTVRTTGKCTPTSFEQFFTIERLSNLAGMILLNGQEREPPSSYAAYISWMREDSDRGTQMNMFHTQLRNENIVIRNLKKGMHGQAVYRIASCFNHSCDPNVVMEYNELKNGLGIIAKAARKVEEFEELTISYIDENLSYPLRQLQLFDHYKFMCQCAKCQREHSLWKPHQVVRNVKSSAVHV